MLIVDEGNFNKNYSKLKICNLTFTHEGDTIRNLSTT